MTAAFEGRPGSPLRHFSRRRSSVVRGRFVGCLLGGAVGDALGAPVEFMGCSEIWAKFGREGIRDFVPSYGRLGAITDDTQMTLFTAEGLIRGWLRGQTGGFASYPSVVAHAYLRWLLTQGRRPACELIPDSEGWLYGHHELHHARAPGLTCLGALEEMQNLGDKARNNNKGCGGVMRVAPVGFFAWHWRDEPAPDEEAFDLACELAAITHGHPTGQLAAGAFAVMILGLACGGSLLEAIDVAVTCLKKRPRHQETLQALEQARALAKSKLPVGDAIAELGEGWVAEEALAIAVYCALVARSLEEGVVYAVNHGGDSDSTGAIAGNLLGAIFGAGAIPARWLNKLELRELISEIGSDLLSFTEWGSHLEEGGRLGESIFDKYPPV